MQRNARLPRELQRLSADPPEGVCVWPDEEHMARVHASVRGPSGTPYAGGMFELDITVPEKYPFQPPSVRFVTPIYHPNIDTEGRICLDTLKLPPKGSWLPSVSLGALLTTIRLLIARPNPDDGLMPDITRQYKLNPTEFAARATALTKKHARGAGRATDGAVDSAPGVSAGDDAAGDAAGVGAGAETGDGAGAGAGVGAGAGAAGTTATNVEHVTTAPDTNKRPITQDKEEAATAVVTEEGSAAGESSPAKRQRA